MFDKALFDLPGARCVLFVLSALTALRACLVVGQAACLAHAVVFLWQGFDVDSQIPMLLLFAAFFVSGHCAGWAASTYADAFADRASADARDELLDAYLTKGSSLISREGVGSATSLALSGIDSFGDYVRLTLPKVSALAIVPLILLAASFAVDWVSGIIMLLAFPAIIMMMVLIGSTAHKAAAARHGQYSRLAGHFVDSLRGMETLRAFGRSRAQGEAVYERSERFREATMKTLRIATLSSAVLDFASTVSTAAVAIMLGFRMVEGSIDFLPALFVLILVPEYFKPIRDFAADYHATLEGKAAHEALRRAVEEARACVAGKGAGAARWAEGARLEARGVGFSYGERCVLDDVSFAVEGACVVGIVGASGSGKSTLASLLAGFARPDRGSFALDGVPAALDSPEWRESVLFVPQHPFIFSATLAENLAFYTPDASRDAIGRAARKVGLDALIDDLPQGLDTPIGDGGRALSGGEAQRVALARALLDRRRRILVFDEPTAHLDIETELELKARMEEAMKGRLVFFATHRLHWTSAFDQVLVIEGGSVVQSGDPRKLACVPGLFSAMLDGAAPAPGSSKVGQACCDADAKEGSAR